MMIVKSATVPLNQGGGGWETFATECSAVDVNDAELKKHSAPLK